MARTVAEIKKDITDGYLQPTSVRAAYGLQDGDTFENSFSKASWENIIFYMIAFAIWTLEVLFDTHKKEINTAIAELKPHSLRWYVAKSKAFMAGVPLMTDSDLYDTSAMSEDAISTARVVKYAAAVEKNAVVYIKIAGDESGAPVQLSDEQAAGFKAYIKEIKDAGVKIEVVNLPADRYSLEMMIYYDPMVLTSTGASLLGGDPVRDCIRNFLKDLPFNGEYRNSALVDALQRVPGVVMPELVLARKSLDGVGWQTIEAYAVPDSGYFKIYDENQHLKLNFKAYETVSD